MRLTKDELLKRSASVIETQEVALPELANGNGEAPTVLVRAMLASEHGAFMDAAYERDGEKLRPAMGRFYRELLSRVVVDDQGEPMLAPEDVDRLPASVADRLTVAAMQIGELDEDVEEMVENFTSGRLAPSSSTSPAS